MEKRTFAIVGGGIGGLTLAIGLQQKGFDVVVYENAPEVKPLGAGIVLAGNAMKAFANIGIDHHIVGAGRIMKQFVIREQSGRVITITNGDDISNSFGFVNTLTLHRADLHQALLGQLTAGTLVLGKRCIGFEQRVDGIHLSFADGASATAEYVIGADGIHSIFRKKLLPSSELRYSGYTCWRGVTGNIPRGFDFTSASESWGAGRRFGIVPLADDKVYWFATTNASFQDKTLAEYTLNDLRNLFSDFHVPVDHIISGTAPEHLLHHDILDVKPIRQFAFGRIALLGDAAHATTPNLGQGACMAIEDAVVLANCVAASSDIPSAFKVYQDKRIKRTTAIVNRSFGLGKLVQIENRFLAKLRNTAIRMTPDSIARQQVKFLYDVSFS